MGYLLKEALKTLCGVNQWSYAAFWKIGCQNTKLLIWEECYYEPVLCSVSSQDSGIGSSLREWEGCLIAPHHDVQARERIELLVNQMMVKNQISIVGEGIIGRAAFTGSHEWILSESYSGDSHPPEVLNEMQHQFSSGMKTVAVIPVSPHGVVQLGSSLSIMENAGFVDEVRNMILQLGYIPGALFSDGYESKSSFELPNHDKSKQIDSSLSSSSAFQASSGIMTPGVSLGRNCYPELSDLVASDIDMLLSQHAASSSQHAASSSHRGDFAQKHDNLEGVPLFRKECLKKQECLKNKNMLVGEILPSWIDEVEEHNNGRSQSTVTNVKYEEPSFEQYSSFGDDLFDIFGEDLKNKILGGNFANLAESSSKKNLDGGFPSHSIGQSFLGTNDFDGDDLLDAVVTKAHSSSKQCSEDNISCKTSLTKVSSSSAPSGSPAYQRVNSSDRIGMETIIYPEKITAPVSCSPSNSFYSSQISSWVEQSHSMKVESSVSTAYSKKEDGTMKPNRKRTKPGENPRPRPKDRQMIQDRVKELREIVPNASKCSIDALLERTIKHMLFLQSVTKHADKLKESGQSKIMNKDGGLAMKENLEGGATWAFEVGSQSMVCPIIVEDLSPPRQMLVEMLCEDRGFFLEIADIVRGLGLTILKGVMESRNGKIWARFTVEANRDVTRMEIFMSLVSLLEQTVGGPSATNAVHPLAQPGTVRPN